jgi:hypothetical protein
MVRWPVFLPRTRLSHLDGLRLPSPCIALSVPQQIKSGQKLFHFQMQIVSIFREFI